MSATRSTQNWDKKRDAIIDSLTNGSTNKEAYELAGVSQKSFYNWYTSNADFKKRVDLARDAGDDIKVKYVEDKLFELCNRGNLGAICFLLKNRASNKWKERQEVAQTVDLTEAQKEELIDRIRSQKNREVI